VHTPSTANMAAKNPIPAANIISPITAFCQSTTTKNGGQTNL